jgi:oligopeptide transport system permease protein
MNAESALDFPSLKHIAGTDPLGRDLAARLLEGARTSLSIAFFTALTASLIGVSLGSLAAYLGKGFDFWIMRLIDFIYSLPDLLILSIIALAFNQSAISIVIGLSLINWMEIARVTRAEIMKLQQEEFVFAAKLIGQSHFKILTQHLIPNSAALILVTLGFIIPRAILSESTLSFIGLGLTPPETSWGTLAGDAFQYLRTHTYLIAFPALMIFLSCFSFNQITDYFARKLNPSLADNHYLKI